MHDDDRRSACGADTSYALNVMSDQLQVQVTVQVMGTDVERSATSDGVRAW